MCCYYCRRSCYYFVKNHAKSPCPRCAQTSKSDHPCDTRRRHNGRKTRYTIIFRRRESHGSLTRPSPSTRIYYTYVYIVILNPICYNNARVGFYTLWPLHNNTRCCSYGCSTDVTTRFIPRKCINALNYCCFVLVLKFTNDLASSSLYEGNPIVFSRCTARTL